MSTTFADPADECIHGLPPQSCSICLHGVTRPEPAAIEATFRARLDGHCPECNLPITAGQWVNKMTDGRYLHGFCA